MSDPEIRYLGEMQKLSLSPGDKLVLSVDMSLTTEQRQRLAEMMRGFAGDTPLIILERGMKLAAVGSDVHVAA